jgi:hypothetical protein
MLLSTVKNAQRDLQWIVLKIFKIFGLHATAAAPLRRTRLVGITFARFTRRQAILLVLRWLSPAHAKSGERRNAVEFFVTLNACKLCSASAADEPFRMHEPGLAAGVLQRHRRPVTACYLLPGSECQ